MLREMKERIDTAIIPCGQPMYPADIIKAVIRVQAKSKIFDQIKVGISRHNAGIQLKTRCAQQRNTATTALGEFCITIRRAQLIAVRRMA